MGDIFVVGAGDRPRRLDLHAVEDSGDGWRNVLPGYHEVRLHGDGVWHVAGFLLAADGLAALRLDGARLVDAHDDTAVARLRAAARTALTDILARDLIRALSDAGNDRPDPDLLSAANALQLALTRD